MNPRGRRTIAFACAVLQGHCTPSFAAAALARDADGSGGPEELLGGLWGTLDVEAQARLGAAFAAAEGDAAAARALVEEAGLAHPAGDPGSLPAYAATLRPAAGVRLTGVTATVPDARRFEVRHEHARGGMGRILIAWDARLGREVALKELLPGIGATVAADGGPGKSALEVSDRERFFREARVTGQLEHPSIVPVYEMGDRDGVPFYAMRLIRGETLAARIDRIGRDEKTAESRLAARLRLIDAMLDVCDAVAYAHSRGVVNRDLKPANVMLGDFGETFVLDWGLARVQGHEDRALPELRRAAESLRRAVDDGPALTLDGAILGTPAYMPPEQARGEIDRVDERSDVYALGAILYEILTGRPPYEGPHPVAVLQAVLRFEPEPVTRAEPLAPRDFAAIAHRALARDPAARFPSALALGAELRACRDGRPLAVYRYGAAEQLARFVRRNRALAAALAAAMLILVGGATVAAVLARHAEGESRAARRAEAEARAAGEETARRAAGEREALEATRRALHRADGLRLAATVQTVIPESPGLALALALEAADRAPGAASNNAILAALRQVRERRRFVGHGFYVLDVAWNPSGTRILTAGADHAAFLWDVESGRALHRLEGHRDRVDSVAFSPDGTRVLTLGQDGTARVWNAETGAAVACLGIVERVTVMGAFDPSGTRVLVWGKAPVVWPLPGGEPVPLEGAPGVALDAAWSPGGTQVAVALGDGGAGIWDAETGRLAVRFEGSDSARAVEFSPDGRRVVIVCGGGSVSIRDAASGEALVSVSAGTEVREAAFSPSGKEIGTLEEPGVLRFRDAGTGAETGAALRGDLVFPQGLSADWGRVLRRDDSAVDILDRKSGDVLARLSGHEYFISGAMFDRTGRRVATASGDLTAAVWDVTEGSAIPRVRLPADGQVLAIDAERDRFLVGLPAGHAAWCGADGRVTAAEEGMPLLPLMGSAGHSLAIPADPEGQPGSLVDLAAGKRIPGAAGAEEMRPMGLAADAPVVAFSDPAGTVVTIDFRTGRERGRFGGSRPGVPLVPSSDGTRVLVLNGRPNEVHVADAATGKILHVLRGHTGGVQHAVFLPGDDAAVSLAWDASVRRWDLRTGKPVAAHRLPRIFSGLLVRTRDGRMVAVVAPDFVRVIETAEMTELFTIPEIRSTAAVFSPDGRELLVPDGRGAVLRVPIDLATFARSVVPHGIGSRELTRYEIGDPTWRRGAIDALDRAQILGMRASLRSTQAVQEGRLEDGLFWGRRSVETCPTYPDCWGAYARALLMQPEGERDLAEAARAVREMLQRRIGHPSLLTGPEFDAIREYPGMEELLGRDH